MCSKDSQADAGCHDCPDRPCYVTYVSHDTTSQEPVEETPVAEMSPEEELGSTHSTLLP